MKNKLPLTIDELQLDLSQKKYNTAQLVKNYLSRIHEFDPQINSFITITDTYAFEKAAAVDQILRDNPKALEEFPLLGVIFSIKDMYLTRGIRTTAASHVLSQFVPQYSATIINRLEKAGAIIIGKVNHDAWAHGASGENSDYGATKNPWNKAYVPGGSSSGSAASVAAQFATASMGTDTGGSIRQPAGFCGVVGLKPTYGAVPRYGVVAMASSLDTMGHITRTAKDSRKIFNVTRGEDKHDSTIKGTTYSRPHSYTIGVPKEYFIDGLDHEVREKVEEAIAVFKSQGVSIKEISLPHTKYAVAVYYIIMPAEVSSNLNRYDGVRYGEGREAFSAEAKRRIMLGTYVLSAGYYDAYYLKAMKVRSKIIADFENVFKEVDAVIAPVSPTQPFKIGEKIESPLEMYLADIFTVAANLAGIPGLALPAGFSKKNLPIGFQLLGSQFSEETLFSLGELYQDNTDFHLQIPKL